MSSPFGVKGKNFNKKRRLSINNFKTLSHESERKNQGAILWFYEYEIDIDMGNYG